MPPDSPTSPDSPGTMPTAPTTAPTNPSATAIPNVLADRYASAEMTAIWSAENKIMLERRLWVEVLRAQRDLATAAPANANSSNINITEGVIADYEAVIDHIDLASIQARERITRHDVKARIEEFSALAGHEHIHRAMTSRDVTENIEQSQIRASLVLVRDRLVAVLARLCTLADRYCDLAMVGRSHNVPAQVTTLGKRWATIGTEVLDAIDRIESLLERLPLRGIKGPVGTQQDMLDLFGGDAAAVAELERRIAEHLGFQRVITSVGQVYPRSHDLDFVAALTLAAAPLGNTAQMVRLMVGQELATEGFKQGQVGSSAMPHKMNTRSSERISGLLMILRGHLAMVAQLAGDQWLEGDVSCSVVRRVVLPDACFAIDGAIETALEVLDDFGAFDALIAAELADYLPFLATTRLLNAAVAAGCGREQAHELIREHALAAVKQRRTGATTNPAPNAEGTSTASTAATSTSAETAAENTASTAADSAANTLLDNIANDSRLALSKSDIADIISDVDSFSGLASQQVKDFIANANGVLKSHAAAATYQPKPTL